ncbi:hypothetical protein TNCV_549951 [Trichonephila clavipes]|nr:hypothetical protein TNCV_549951 [Trichonephila clavipes]
MSSESNKEAKKKPCKGYIVPSRYKQAAKNFSSQASNSKDSDIKCAESVLQSNINTKLGDSILPKHGSTKKFSSTPAIEGRHALPSIDASAITDFGESLIISRDTATIDDGLPIYETEVEEIVDLAKLINSKSGVKIDNETPIKIGTFLIGLHCLETENIPYAVGYK